jgi:hypothetical protein
MPADENSLSDVGRKGLSKEAWVAIGTISAALITGVVTVIIHLVPQKPAVNSAPTPSPAAVASTTASTPASTSAAINADAIAGKWVGDAKESDGTPFIVTLEVRKSCGINERCGSISVSHVPCYGEIFLEKARDEDFEFRTKNFYGESNFDKCAEGPGEFFHLRPDGKLDYWTSYDSKGILQRQAG